MMNKTKKLFFGPYVERMGPFGLFLRRVNGVERTDGSLQDGMLALARCKDRCF